jgi:hypothetical protein
MQDILLCFISQEVRAYIRHLRGSNGLSERDIKCFTLKTSYLQCTSKALSFVVLWLPCTLLRLSFFFRFRESAWSFVMYQVSPLSATMLKEGLKCGRSPSATSGSGLQRSYPSYARPLLQWLDMWSRFVTLLQECSLCEQVFGLAWYLTMQHLCVVQGLTHLFTWLYSIPLFQLLYIHCGSEISLSNSKFVLLISKSKKVKLSP